MNDLRSIRWSILLIGVAAFLVAGCATQLTPQVSYQGRLTDDSGQPLTGDYQLTFGLYDQASGGSAIYTETDTVTAQAGLFDTVVGPGSGVAGLSPEDLAKPLWLEVSVSNGTITETLTPRQRLYGAPYAFTLMPGTLISSTMAANTYAGSGITGVATIFNGYDGDGSDQALPALRVVGENGVELASPTGDNGTIISDQNESSSDLFFYSQDNVQFYLDNNNDETGTFSVLGSTGSCSITEAGNLSCSGTKSASVTIQDEQRLMYAIESPEVWFEDFGEGRLENGTAVVSIDPQFAEAADLESYHVYLTPLGDCQGLYVSNKTATSFEVHELGSGSADVAFDYRIVAHRANYEEVRLEVDPSAMSDIEEGK